MRRVIIAGGIAGALVALLGTVGWVGAADQGAAAAARPEPSPERRAAATPPRVVGEWVGTWGLYTPPRPGVNPKPSGKSPAEMRLDCRVVALPKGGWQATFEGECGRPYKYTVEMRGRQVGSAVLFQGTADLGEKDGGVYDWIGRAAEDEFVGFYTSQKYTGHFRLARKAAEGPVANRRDRLPPRVGEGGGRGSR